MKKKYNIIYADPPWKYKKSGFWKKESEFGWQTFPTKKDAIDWALGDGQDYLDENFRHMMVCKVVKEFCKT